MPYGGILVTLVIYAFGVVLNYLVPSQVFEIVLNISSAWAWCRPGPSSWSAR